MEGSRRILSSLRWLDKLPPWAGLTLGLIPGLAAGLLLVLADQPWAFAAFVALLAVVVPLVITAQPVGVVVKKELDRKVEAPAREPEAPAREVEAPAREPEIVPLEPELPRRVEDLDGFIAMIELPGGTFLMGSPDNDKGRYKNERPQHKVTVSPFAIGETQVTQTQYEEVMSNNPSKTKGATLPVTDVRWFDAVEFCNRLSKRAQLTPCYRIDGTKVEWDRQANGYRLPTEAEWEYAARAGTTTAYSFGADPAGLYENAWFGGSAGNINPVGTKRANPWGIYDVHGNVWEWCWDRFDRYTRDTATNPEGPQSGTARVLRGGSSWSVPRLLRSAFRVWNEPGDKGRGSGFRCVRSL